MRINRLVAGLAGMALAVTMTHAYAADDGVWVVSKTSGDVWVGADKAMPAALKQEETLKPGDTIRTGRNGRVLLKRGEETIMISPNSVVGLPAEKKEGLSTTILQRAGSILLEVEKRNVKHFEVETPYLAAVVKGTQFQVTVSAGSTNVAVKRGQVEVSDFRSGQIAQVRQGQRVTTFASGRAGLTLAGSGTFSPIEQGRPRTPTIDRVPVPRAGLTAPRPSGAASTVAARANAPRAFLLEGASQRNRAASVSARPSATRISSPIGEVKLNIHRVTRGLANTAHTAQGNGGRNSLHRENSPNSQNANAAFGNSGAASAAVGAASANGPATTAPVASAGETGRDNDNGRNGANGNGNGHNRYRDKHADNNGNGRGHGNGRGNGNGHR